ncbi:hypothetical protein VP01_1596g6 [Puccinia sorghi]|uniref:Uncharacterized protein n=1 Tax=Puccinia sorghi TaxID=27349 RepID=A0A0L6VJ98_9BASI|nr:hypothetical protein VP01_1596g6 [Puccinia sorghi]
MGNYFFSTSNDPPSLEGIFKIEKKERNRIIKLPQYVMKTNLFSGHQMHLLARKAVPLLLMSETCCPLAFEAIIKYLEAGFIQLEMFGDFSYNFLENSPNHRHPIANLMDVLYKVRESQEDVPSPTSNFEIQFHSCTRKTDKIQFFEDFALGKIRKNSFQARSVIHVEFGKPSAASQMIGRCFCDFRGFPILFFEKSCVHGKN